MLERELRRIEKCQEKLRSKAGQPAPKWRQQLESRVPEKVYSSLEAAFAKGFAIVFEKGESIISKSFDKDKLLEQHLLKDSELRSFGRRRELKRFIKTAEQSSRANMGITTISGIGLGALGIGLPDIVLFLATLLRGIYQTAQSYGFDYKSSSEQMLILEMMAASLSRGEDRLYWEQRVQQRLEDPAAVKEEELGLQIRQTASVFAVDMLVLKFIQGMPLVGLIGGISDPVYYKKVMDNVKLIYRKRYLLALCANNIL